MRKLFIILLLSGCTVKFEPSPDFVKEGDFKAALVQERQVTDGIIKYLRSLQIEGVLPDPSKKKDSK